MSSLGSDGQTGAADQKGDEGEEEAKSRSGYVKSTVTVDIVKDLRDQVETARAESDSHQRKQLLWSKVAAALIFIYTGITYCTYQGSVTGSAQQHNDTIESLFQAQLSAIDQHTDTVMALNRADTANRNSQTSAREQLRAMRTQQWIMQGQLDQMVAQQRPWVSVVPKIQNNELTAQDKSFWITLLFEFQNTGESPAFNIVIEPDIIAVASPLEPALNTLDEAQKLLCSKAAHDSTHDASAGIAVFPNIAAHQVRATPLIAVPDGKSWYIVQGCIDYTYAGGRHGKTAFRMQLKPKQTTSHSPNYFIWFQENRSEWVGGTNRMFMNAEPFVFEPTDRGGNWAR